MDRLVETLRRDESGLSKLEFVGLLAFIVSMLALIGPLRDWAIDVIGIVFDQVDPDTGELNDFSVAMRGFAIVGSSIIVFIGSGCSSIIVFIGSGWLLLWTNLGRRLAFLLTGAATFGWLVINGILFVVYAPRGIRPENLEGLNALQVRLPAMAMTAGSIVLMLMFLVALSRYESDNE
jgi:hypothetical protein